MADEVDPGTTHKSTPEDEKAKDQSGETKTPYRPNFAVVLATALLCTAMIAFILVYADLRNNQLAEVMAGVFSALLVSVILFSVVPSTAIVRAVVGFGGAALFFFEVWPLIEKAIHPPPFTMTLRGSIDYIGSNNGAGHRPVQGAVVEIANTSLKSQQPTGETGEFIIFDVPSNVTALEVVYKGQVYSVDLSKFKGKTRYDIIPADAPAPADTVSNRKLDEAFIVDASLEVTGPYWERTTISLPDAYIDASGNANRYRICAQPQGDYVVDETREGFRGGLIVGSAGGDNYHSEMWDGNCFVLYCAANNGRGSNSWARGLKVALKRLHAPALCGRTEKNGTALTYSGVNQIQLDTTAALGPCTGPDLPAQPKWTTTVAFRRPTGAVVDTARFEGFDQTHALNGSADLWVNTSALLSIALKAK
jgi:hypothetical protein